MRAQAALHESNKAEAMRQSHAGCPIRTQLMVSPTLIMLKAAVYAWYSVQSVRDRGRWAKICLAQCLPT
jgi:hypothetical protein